MLARHRRGLTLCNHHQSITGNEPVKFCIATEPLFKPLGKLQLCACSRPSAMSSKLAARLYDVVTARETRQNQERQVSSCFKSFESARSTARLILHDKGKQFRIGLIWSVHNAPLWKLVSTPKRQLPCQVTDACGEGDPVDRSRGA